jgi:hypothetical protein
MALQKRFNDSRKQFVDPYWTIISSVLSHGRGRSKLALDRRECVILNESSAGLDWRFDGNNSCRIARDG